MYCIKVAPGQDDTTDLSTTKASKLEKAPTELSEELRTRTAPKKNLQSISKVYTTPDYAAMPATAIHLGALASMLVPAKARDLSGVVYEVFHCVVDNIEPVSSMEALFYMGCPQCKKKMAVPRPCEHTDAAIPFFLGNVTFVTLEHQSQAKVIGDVMESLLQVPASDCIPDAQGYAPKLEAALDTLRSTPYNLKLIITMTPDGDKNVLDIVHAVPTLNVSTGGAAFPCVSWRLVDTDIEGIPPCALDSVKRDDTHNMLFERPVKSVQVFISITDSGDEHGAMSRDGYLVRLRRSAVCCLSGAKVVLHRTGNLGSMSKYLRWDKGDVIFTVARILDYNDDTWHLAIKGARKFNDEGSQEIFNAYFIEYVAFAQAIWKLEPLAIDHSWTPKRRRTEIGTPTSPDPNSQSLLTPRTFPRTPIQHNDPPNSS